MPHTPCFPHGSPPLGRLGAAGHGGQLLVVYQHTARSPGSQGPWHWSHRLLHLVVHWLNKNTPEKGRGWLWYKMAVFDLSTSQGFLSSCPCIRPNTHPEYSQFFTVHWNQMQITSRYLNKMASIFKMIFSNIFSLMKITWIKSCVFQSKFNWGLFLFTIFYLWFRLVWD